MSWWTKLFGKKERQTLYPSFEKAAEAIVAAVNEVSPIAPEERGQYEAEVASALREDTRGELHRCDYVKQRFVIEYLTGTGFATMRVSLDLLFPKTMGVI